MKRNPDLKVPYSPVNDQLMHHPGPRRREGHPGDFPDVGEWRPNHEFEATLRFKGTARGRSAAYFLWEDEAGNTWPMFISDVGLLISEGMRLQPGGVVSGRWFVVKRGQNFGITPVVGACTCSSAGSVFAPAGHYADCPAAPRDGTTEATDGA